MSLTVQVLVPHIQDPNLVLTVPVDALALVVRHTCISFQVAITYFKYSLADEAI